MTTAELRIWKLKMFGIYAVGCHDPQFHTIRNWIDVRHEWWILRTWSRCLHTANAMQIYFAVREFVQTHGDSRQLSSTQFTPTMQQDCLELAGKVASNRWWHKLKLVIQKKQGQTCNLRLLTTNTRCECSCLCETVVRVINNINNNNNSNVIIIIYNNINNNNNN